MQAKDIVTSAMTRLTEDSTYVRIATLTSFISSLIFNLYIVLYLFLYSGIFSEKTPFWKLLHDYVSLVHLDSSMIWRGIVIALFLFIWYELIPPIWEATMIYYLDDPAQKKDPFRAIAKWLYKFFPMLEFWLSISLFKASVIILVMIRLVLFDLLDNTLVFILMSIWITISFFVNLLLPYSEMLICLKWYDFFDAMKRSVSMSIQNLGVTIKFVVINTILSIRFFINMAIIIGIPIGLVALWTQLGLQDIWRLNALFFVILVWLIFLAAYIEWIIAGFFTAARVEIYKKLSAEE